MALKRQVFVFFAALALTFFILFIMLTSIEICPTDMSVSKRRNGDFLKLPDTDCSRNPPYLVILVTSQLGQIKARSVIRETWGKEREVAGKRIVTYFLLGNNSRPDDQIVVSMEGLRYKDIIQKDFMDTYNNLTLKTLMGLEWIHKFCSQTKFVMKTDSDMFINTYYLVELLLKRNRTTRLFTGALKMHGYPIRDPGSKWFVSKEEYPGNYYPPFCSGTGYVFSTDVANEVYTVSKKVPFFKLEDVFIGLCLAELKIKPEELHSEPTFFSDWVEFSICRYKKIITSHYITPKEMLIYWNILERSMYEECLGQEG